MQIIQLRVEKKSQHANTPTDHHSVNEKNISRDPNRKKKTRKNQIPPIVIGLHHQGFGT